MRSTFVVFVFLGLVAAGCGGGTEGPVYDGLEYDLHREGPFNTGYLEWDITYTPLAGGASRTIPLHVWYPTRDEDSSTGYPTYSGLFFDSDSLMDARPAAPVYPAGYPVLVYSHGHRGVAGGSARLARYLASHGWLSVAPGHVGNRLEDGAAAEVSSFNHWLERALDVSAALDALGDLPPQHPLAALANVERVLVTGHSRGAYTSWALAGASFDREATEARCDQGVYAGGCSQETLARMGLGLGDSRVVAIMPTAGSGHSEFFDGVGGRDHLGVPVLMMSAEADDVGAGRLFETLNIEDFTWVEIKGGCHELFNLGCGFREDRDKFPIVTTYALAFGRRQVLRDKDVEVLKILEEEAAVSEHARLLRR